MELDFFISTLFRGDYVASTLNPVVGEPVLLERGRHYGGSGLEAVWSLDRHGDLGVHFIFRYSILANMVTKIPG